MQEPLNLVAEFDRYAKDASAYKRDADTSDQWKYSELAANWYAVEGGWWFQCGSTAKGIFNSPEECVQTFKSLAGRAAIATKLCGPEHPEPWRVWLDELRPRGWWRGCGFHVDRVDLCTELEWDAGVNNGKSLNQVRREHPEWERFWKAKNGEMRSRRARELRGKSSDDLKSFYHQLESGKIEHVFYVSARFYEELTGLAVAHELGQAAPSSNGLVVASKVKRGRPSEISIEAKEQALEVKRKGGSWGDAAKVLYNETYPTPRHVKDAPKVLANYQKSCTIPEKILNISVLKDQFFGSIYS